jgi:hypothetical protein
MRLASAARTRSRRKALSHKGRGDFVALPRVPSPLPSWVRVARGRTCPGSRRVRGLQHRFDPNGFCPNPAMKRGALARAFTGTAHAAAQALPQNLCSCSSSTEPLTSPPIRRSKAARRRDRPGRAGNATCRTDARVRAAGRRVANPGSHRRHASRSSPVCPSFVIARLDRAIQ